MRAFYLLFLLFSLAGMVIADRQLKLTFFADARRAWIVCLGCVAALLCWDALGIATAAFYRGDSPYMLGIELAPEMPLEEPIFLFFLTYLTLNVTAISRRIINGRSLT